MVALDEYGEATEQLRSVIRREAGVPRLDSGAMKVGVTVPLAARDVDHGAPFLKLDEHAAAGIDHAIVRLEPKTPASLERLDEAVALHRGRRPSATIGAP